MSPSPLARRPTIVEVAQLAGVSHQTVSRYLRAPDGLKPATRSRVDAAVKQLNYTPNLVARSMRTRRTGRLAVIVPALLFNPARLVAGASAVAHAAGYALDVVSLEGDIEARTARVSELADSSQVEGIVSFAPVLATFDGSVQQGATVVLSSDFDDHMRGIGDLADGSPVRELVSGLAALGHRRFLHIAGDMQFASARGRSDTYLATIADLHLESVGVADGDWTAESGYRAVRMLDAEAPPTAVIAANDVVAAGAIRAAGDRGWNVPGDLSVTGWDDLPIGQYLYPSLTTVDVDLERIGARGMARLIAILRGDATDAPLERLNTVVWRESTGPVPVDTPPRVSP